MVMRQRAIALASGGAVLAGRDIGTVVLADASLKVFLTASLPVRAMRRRMDLLERGQDVPLGFVIREIERRDGNDSGREISPLVCAPDAVTIISDALT